MRHLATTRAAHCPDTPLPHRTQTVLFCEQTITTGICRSAARTVRTFVDSTDVTQCQCNDSIDLLGARIDRSATDRETMFIYAPQRTWSVIDCSFSLASSSLLTVDRRSSCHCSSLKGAQVCVVARYRRVVLEADRSSARRLPLRFSKRQCSGGASDCERGGCFLFCISGHLLTR